MPIDDERRTVGGLALIEDVSERRRLEAMRRDFVANVSHELKTPVGALGLLAETLATEDDPVVARRLAQRMEGNAMRLGRMIDDLLELSRIEAEQAPLREPVPVHLVVAEAVEQVRAIAEREGVEVHVAEARHTLTVTGDRRQIVSAIFNLLDNAVKYSEAGSSVDLRVVVTEGGDRVGIEVRDKGAGIPSTRSRACVRALLPGRPGSVGRAGHRSRARHRAPCRRQPRRRGATRIARG